MFLTKFLRKICGLKINKVIQRYEIRSNEEVYNAFDDPNIIGVIRSKRLSWLGDVLRTYMIIKEVLS